MILESCKDLYNGYDVRIRFRSKVLGGIPRSKELIGIWLRVRHKGQSIRQEEIERIDKAAGADDSMESRSWTVFMQDKNGLFLEEKNIKGLLKEAARLLRRSSFRDLINHGVWTRPQKLYLLRNGRPIPIPDGHVERPLQVGRTSGPTAALKREDYVTGASLKFHLFVVAAALNEEIENLLKIGEEIGLGASRSLGFGKFDVKVIPL